jgi:hypothetical protein
MKFFSFKPCPYSDVLIIFQKLIFYGRLVALLELVIGPSQGHCYNRTAQHTKGHVYIHVSRIHTHEPSVPMWSSTIPAGPLPKMEFITTLIKAKFAKCLL